MIDFKLMKHQEEALWKSQFEPDLFLAWDMGVGKSCATIQMIRARSAEQGRLCKTLILAPLIVLKNWKKELSMFSDIDTKQVFVLEGPIAKRVAFVTSQIGYSSVLITNYDALQNKDFVTALKKWCPEILVADEVHNCKSYQSKRAKSVAEIADLCKHRYLLSGTPILNNAMDLFMQFRILDGYLGKNATFPSNFFVFRSTYFVDENASWSSKPGHFPKWVPRETAYAELLKKIEKKTLRITKAQCLDLPPLVTQNIDVGLSDEQLVAYNQMSKEYVTWVQDQLGKGEPRAVVARLAITKSLRLQQIVSGFVNTDDGSTVRFKNPPRIKVLQELLEMIAVENKVIIWCCFKENYKMIAELCREMDLKYVEVHGEVPNAEKFKNVEEFNKNPSVRVLIGNQGAGGVGINLVSATYSIYYSRGFKLGDDLQSEARNYRRGSEVHDKITRINLVCPNSIDGIISEALEMKLDISDAILNFTSRLGKSNGK